MNNTLNKIRFFGWKIGNYFLGSRFAQSTSIVYKLCDMVSYACVYIILIKYNLIQIFGRRRLPRGNYNVRIL